ncbi:hypothetical protein ACFO5R_06270 [Halosolutus amylolyticus]|uniref:Gins51 C-terminal domain-containing protein n=1 Tax=Halosolutus amylolyticus TaxID=2932267 RepID=A0ABD5PLY3_9EURY|nr:hypothetical protein [Halosolutus amylolyticus]
MNLDELRSVQSKERQKDSLQNLRPSFYQEVGDYIADLEAERDRVAEQADDPFSSPEVGRLTDEIETARDVVEAIYERRMGKLVKQASLSAAGMPADDEGLTAEEQDLFSDLVDRIQSNKGRVLETLEGGPDEAASDATPATTDDDPVSPDAPPTRDDPGQADAPPAPPEEPVPEQVPPEDGPATGTTADGSGVTPADVMGGDPASTDLPAREGDGDETPSPPDSPDPEPAETDVPGGPSDRDRSEPATDATPAGNDRSAATGAGGDDRSDVDRLTVRITQDVGSILGVDDREYTLSRDDVVTLPEQNATPLVEQEAAEPLE